MDTNSAGFSLLSKSMQKRIMEAQGESVPAEEVKPQAVQPVAQPTIADALHAENVRKYGEVDADRMRKYGLSASDL